MKMFKGILASMVLGTVVLSTSASPAAASSTFIKEEGKDSIYMIHGSRYCGVVNMDHLDILGGHNFQEMPSREFKNVTGNASYVGKCGLPSGFYKGRDTSGIYMVRGSNSCWVTDMNQYGRLKNKYGFSNFREVSDIYSVTNLHRTTGACQG